MPVFHSFRRNCQDSPDHYSITKFYYRSLSQLRGPILFFLNEYALQNEAAILNLIMECSECQHFKTYGRLILASFEYCFNILLLIDPHACTNITNPYIMIWFFMLCLFTYFFFILILPVNFLFTIIIIFSLLSFLLLYFLHTFSY